MMLIRRSQVITIWYRLRRDGRKEYEDEPPLSFTPERIISLTNIIALAMILTPQVTAFITPLLSGIILRDSTLVYRRRSYSILKGKSDPAVSFKAKNKLFGVDDLGEYLNRIHNAGAGPVKVLVSVGNVNLVVFYSLQLVKARQL